MTSLTVCARQHKGVGGGGRSLCAGRRHVCARSSSASYYEGAADLGRTLLDSFGPPASSRADSGQLGQCVIPHAELLPGGQRLQQPHPHPRHSSRISRAHACCQSRRCTATAAPPPTVVWCRLHDCLRLRLRRHLHRHRHLVYRLTAPLEARAWSGNPRLFSRPSLHHRSQATCTGPQPKGCHHQHVPAKYPQQRCLACGKHRGVYQWQRIASISIKVAAANRCEQRTARKEEKGNGAGACSLCTAVPLSRTMHRAPHACTEHHNHAPRTTTMHHAPRTHVCKEDCSLEERGWAGEGGRKARGRVLLLNTGFNKMF